MALTKITIPSTVTALTTTQYNAIQANIDYILGDGEGDYGYGQTFTSNELASGATLTTTTYNELAAKIRRARVHQTGTAGTSLIPELSSGATITSTYIQKLVTQVNLADTNRLAIPPVGANSTITELASKSTTDIQEWNGVTTHTVEVEFDTAENMRYFFNTGGQIQFLASRVTTSPVSKNVSVPKNTSWTTLLKSIGTINFSRTKTTSTSKVGGTLIGFANLFDSAGDPTEGKVIFQKYASEPAFKLNSYTITAGISPNSDTAILFSIEFNDASLSTPELNVGGSLSSIVKAYRATGVNVEVPLPNVSINDLSLGVGAPTYAIERSALSISELDTAGADFIVTTTNVDDYTTLFWTISGTNITEGDFDLNAMGVTSITSVPFTITSNSSEAISIIASADALKEGTEKFNFAVRTSATLTAIPVIQLPALSLEKIDDTSLPVQVVPVTSFYFESQSVTSFKEGTAATFVVGAVNMKVSTVVYWDIVYGDGDIDKLDFANSTDTGKFTFPAGRSTYSLSIKLTGKDGQDPGESFKVQIYTVVDGLNVYHDTSARIDIIDDYVAAPVIPEPSITITGNISSIEEGSAAGVEFTVSVPSMATNSKLYWVAKSDSGTTLLKDEDFSKTYVVGGYGKGGTANSFVVVQANKKATLKRFAAKDTETEGIESFTVEFYSDPLYQNFIIGSSPISITETVGYSITSTPISAVEGSATGIRFNVSTPYMPSGKLWWTIQLTGNLTGDDFDTVTDWFPITDSVGYFDVFPKKDNIIEGDQLFQVDIRTESAAGPVKITGKGTITEDPTAYSIDAITTVAEGGSVTYNITTPYTTSGFLYWTVSSVTGSVTDLDFLETDHKISIENSHGSFTLHPKPDNSTEGTESFKIVLHKTSMNGPIVYTQPEPVYITEVVEYAIGLQNGVTSINEGGNVLVNITTPYTAANTPLFWEIKSVSGNFIPSDITVVDYESSTRTSKFTGEVRTALVTTNNITVSQASFRIYIENDSLTEGTEQFKIYLKQTSTGQPIKETGVIDATELVPWTMLTYDPDTSAAATEVEEGKSIKFVITTPYRPNNTALYWKAVSGGMGSAHFTTTTGTGEDLEFTPMSGVVYTSNNTTSIFVSPAADKFTEGNVNFKIRIYELPSTMSTTDINALTYTSVISESNFRIESYPVMILDSSETPPEPEVLPPKILSIIPYQNSQEVTSILEGSGTFSYVITSENIAEGQTLYWNLITVNVFTGNILPGTSGTVTVGAGGITPINFTSVFDDAHNDNKTVVMAVKLTQYAAKSNTDKVLTITKEQKFTVTPYPLTVKEGGEVSFTITTPSASASSNLIWTIEPYASYNITASDFIDKATGNPLSSLSGTVTIDSKGVGTVSLKINDDALPEGPEQFVISLKKSDLTAITLGTPCPPVTITESMGYTISASTPHIVEGGGANTGRVTFTVTTPKMSQATTTLKYKVEQVEGTIRNTDFEEFALFGSTDPLVNSFDVTLNNGQYTGTFYLTARSDGQIEGNDKDKFRIRLYDINMTPIDATMTPSSISIRENSSYSVSLTKPGETSPAPSSVLEKTKVTFYVSAPQDDGTKLYWRAKKGDVATILTPDDFSELADKTAMTGYSYVYGNQTTISLTPQNGNKTFTIEINSESETGSPIAGVSAPTVTVTHADTYTVTGSPGKVTEGQSVTFAISHPAVANNTMYWKLVGTSGAPIAPSDFTLNDVELTSLSGSNINMTDGGGQTSMVFGIKQDTVPKSKKGFMLQVSLSNSPFTPVSGGISNEITFTDAGSFILRADKTSVGAGDTVTFYLTPSPSSTLKNIFWKVPAAAVSYFDSTITPSVSGTISLSNKNSSGEIPIKLTLAKTFATPITTDVSFSLELYEETSTGAAIVPDPTASVLITGDYSITPSSGLIDANGTAITFTAPSSVNTLYWKLDDLTKASWFAGGLASGTKVRANGVFPALTVTPTTEGKNGKTFQIIISDQNSGAAKLTSGQFTMPTTVTKPAVTIVLQSTKSPTTSVLASTPMTFEVSVSPNNIPITWTLTGDSATVAGLLYNGSKASSGTLSTLTSVAGSNVWFGTLSLTSTATVAPGKFAVKYTVTDANGGTVSVSSPDIVIAAPAALTLKTVRFYKTGSLAIPPNTKSVSVVMSGGGGQGGGMSVAFGGNGSNGDKITGNLTIPSGATKLKFNIVPGGAMFSTTADKVMGMGGAGGAGVELFIDDTYVATAAGGGGGAGGATVPVPNPTNPAAESAVMAAGTSTSSTRSTTGGAKAAAAGAGAGGYPGGVSGIGTRAVTGYAKCATGGTGGVSTVSAAGNGLTITNSSAPQTTTVTYTKYPSSTNSVAGRWCTAYRLGYTSGKGSATQICKWELVDLPAGDYILTTIADDSGYVTINNIQYKFAASIKYSSVRVPIPADWNRTIIMSYKQNSNGDGPYYGAATLRLVSDSGTSLAMAASTVPPAIEAPATLNGAIPSIIKWHSGMPATIITVAGQGGGGAGGLGVATTGGIDGVPLLDTGAAGDPAYIEITIPTSTGYGIQEFKSPGNNTVVIPEGITLISVVAIGGGGAGGDTDGKTRAGGGGGAGGYISCNVVVSPGSTFDVHVGAGGVGTTSADKTTVTSSSGCVISALNGISGALNVGGAGGSATASGTGVIPSTIITPTVKPGVSITANPGTTQTGGNGSNNGSKYGAGGNGAKYEKGTQNAGSKGTDGYVSITFVPTESVPAANAATPATTPATTPAGWFYSDDTYDYFVAPSSTEADAHTWLNNLTQTFSPSGWSIKNATPPGITIPGSSAAWYLPTMSIATQLYKYKNNLSSEYSTFSTNTYLVGELLISNLNYQAINMSTGKFTNLAFNTTKATYLTHPIRLVSKQLKTAVTTPIGAPTATTPNTVTTKSVPYYVEDRFTGGSKYAGMITITQDPITKKWYNSSNVEVDSNGNPIR